jgi:hypothetical protein
MNLETVLPASEEENPRIFEEAEQNICWSTQNVAVTLTRMYVGHVSVILDRMCLAACCTCQ